MTLGDSHHYTETFLGCHNSKGKGDGVERPGDTDQHLTNEYNSPHREELSSRTWPEQAFRNLCPSARRGTLTFRSTQGQTACRGLNRKYNPQTHSFWSYLVPLFWEAVETLVCQTDLKDKGKVLGGILSLATSCHPLQPSGL